MERKGCRLNVDARRRLVSVKDENTLEQSLSLSAATAGNSNAPLKCTKPLVFNAYYMYGILYLIHPFLCPRRSF